MILEFDAPTKAKISQLKQIRKDFGTIEVYELIKIHWLAPDNAITYCATGDVFSDLLPNTVRPCQVRTVADFPNLFKSIPLNAALSDDEIDVTFTDFDDEFTRLFEANGEGVKVEIFLWCPQVELLLNIFQGHLLPADDADLYFWNGKISSGFRSPDMKCPGRGHYKDECQATFGGELETLAEIADNDCPYNVHLGGSTGLLNGAVPFTTCNKTKANCAARLGDTLSHLSHATMEEAVFNGQTSGGNLYPTARGKETNLTQTVRAIMGNRWASDVPPMAIIKQYNNNNANQGFVRALYGGFEGPVQSLNYITVNDRYVDPIQYTLRNGDLRQSPTNFSPNAHNYSGTAYFQAVLGPVNPADYNSGNLRAMVAVEGLRIKNFASANITDFTLANTTNRSFQIVEILTNKRWSYGLDISRINIESFYECGVWGNDYVNFTDPFNTVWGHYRSASNVELNERELGQQLEDMCSAGGFSRPFVWNGKVCMIPLRALTAAELADCPVFTNNLDNPNILTTEIGGAEVANIRYSKQSDKTLPNRIEVTFDNYLLFHKSEKFSVQDDVLQRKAGRLYGDKSRRKVSKSHSLLGVVEKSQAVKNAWKILDVGEFCEGGIKNNLEVSIAVDWLDALELHVFKKIKIDVPKINAFGFDCFQIKKLTRNDDLSLSVTSQAWNNDYLANLETIAPPPPPPPPPPPNGGGCILTFGNVVYDPNGTLELTIEPC